MTSFIAILIMLIMIALPISDAVRKTNFDHGYLAAGGLFISALIDSIFTTGLYLLGVITFCVTFMSLYHSAF